MALREILARFGFQIDRRGLAAADKGIAGVVGKLHAFGAVIAGSMVVRGIANFVGDIVDAGDALGKTATQLGLSSDQLQAWQAAAGYAGVETTKFNQSMRVLQKNTLLAAQGSKQAKDAFELLNVEFEDANGQLKSGDVLMREVGLALNDLENSTERVALAQQLMGRTGAALLPLFKDGEIGLDAALAALERFGGGLSKELIPLAEAAQDRFADFSLATTSLKSALAVAFLPILNQVVLGLAKFFAAISKAAKSTNLFQAILVTLGAVLLKVAIAKFGGQLLGLARAALLPMLKIALLILIVEDLITLFKGGKSVIGEFIDRLFGKGTAAAVVKGIKDISSAAAEAIKTGNFEKLDQALEDVFAAPGADIVADIVFTFKMIGEAISTWASDVLSDISFTFSMIWDAIVGVIQSIGETVGDWAAAGVDLAGSLIDGLISGIKAGAQAVATAIGNVATGALDFAKRLVGAGSPSKLAREQVGEPLVEGLFDMRAATRAAARFAITAQAAIPTPPTALAATRTGGGAAIPRGGIVFQSQVDLSVSGGAPSDPQIQKLRQRLRSELTDNRRATLAALTQTVEATT